jgi:hypothetical protein
VSHQSPRSFSSRDRVHIRFVESSRVLTRALLFVVGEARFVGRRERWPAVMGLRGVFGRSLASCWFREGCTETCDARGEGMLLGRVEGAVMLREEECARTAGVSTSLWREAQQPWSRVLETVVLCMMSHTLRQAIGVHTMVECYPSTLGYRNMRLLINVESECRTAIAIQQVYKCKRRMVA